MSEAATPARRTRGRAYAPDRPKGLIRWRPEGAAGGFAAAAKIVLTAAVFALALGVPTARPLSAAPAAPAGSAVLGRGWARVVAVGTLVSTLPSAALVSVSFAAQSRADVFEGGTVWRTRRLAGIRLVHLLPQTVMMDSAARPIAPEVPRAGDRVAMWGAMTPGDEIVAAALVVATARPQIAVQPAATGSGHVAGVVAARSDATLEVLTDAGIRHAVVLTGTTQVRAAGAAPQAVGPFDVLQIDGAVNSDGSLVATRVNVDFLSSQAAQVSGPIESLEGDLDGFVVGETMVCTSTHTYFLHGGARLWWAQMSMGQPVTVYGVPIMAGKTPIGLAARVVAVH
jgi:Domain of unknown function (DUF5666)